MKPQCTQCKYYRFPNIDAYSEEHCVNPKVILPYFNQVRGLCWTHESCGSARKSGGRCEYGKYFERKETIYSRLTRLID